MSDKPTADNPSESPGEPTVSIDGNSNVNMNNGSHGGGEGADAALGEPPEPPADGTDWRGWVLVAVVVIAAIVAPGIIYLSPPQLPFKFSYLVLPLIPAFLLGATAVWVAISSRRTR